MALLVPIATRLTIPEAVVMRSCLEARGIVASLDAVHFAAMAWHLTNAIHGVTLSVARSDAERAKALLATTSLPARTETTDTAPGLLTEIIQAVVAVGIWALTGLPCPYWERRLKPDRTTETGEV